jgi:type VI secretion system secreted protein VgrG
MASLTADKLGPISDATAAAMPKAVGEQIDIPGSSMTTVGRNLMGDVNGGMTSTVANQQSALLTQLGAH